MAQVGMNTTYDNTGGAIRVIGDPIKFIDPVEAPCLSFFGTTNEKKFGLDPWPSRGVSSKYEWQEQEMSPRSGTLNEADDGSETALDLQSGEGSYLRTGHVIKVGDELMWVASVATDTITVIRGWGTSTAAAHDDDTAWEIVGTSSVEGSDFVTGHRSEPTQPYNYRQIIKEAVTISGSREVGGDYGIPDVLARQIAMLIGGGNGFGSKGKAGTLSILLAKTFYHGTRLVGTAALAGGMGGVDTFVTTNVTAMGGAALTREVIDDAVEDCWLAGGSPETIVCNSWPKRKMASFFEGTIRTDRTETTGGSHITRYETAMGIGMDVVLDRWCPANKMYILEKDRIGWVTYRPFAIYDRASTGDYMVKDVLGEFGFVVQNEKAHAIISGFSTTA